MLHTSARLHGATFFNLDRNKARGVGAPHARAAGAGAPARPARGGGAARGAWPQPHSPARGASRSGFPPGLRSRLPDLFTHCNSSRCALQPRVKPYDTASLTRQVWRSSSTTLPVRVAAYSTTQHYTSTVGCYATRACATPACANLLACRRGTSQHPTNDAITCTHWPRPEFPFEAPQISFINLPDSGPNLQKIRLKIPACS